MNNLFQNQTSESSPLECLGRTIENDQSRCEHYLNLLVQKLKDPEFRKIG